MCPCKGVFAQHEQASWTKSERRARCSVHHKRTHISCRLHVKMLAWGSFILRAVFFVETKVCVVCVVCVFGWRVGMACARCVRCVRCLFVVVAVSVFAQPAQKSHMTQKRKSLHSTLFQHNSQGVS